MTQCVVDASVAIKWFVPEIHSIQALRLLQLDAELLAPELILAEVGNILWKKCRLGELDMPTAGELLHCFKRSALTIKSHDGLLDNAWHIATQYQQTFYDSLYLSLAVANATRLATADRKFFDALAETPLAAYLLWIEDLD
jgi:predicted nucleic acid-binding protein